MPIKSTFGAIVEVPAWRIESLLEDVREKKGLYGVRQFLEMKLSVCRYMEGRIRKPLYRDKIRHKLKKRGVTFVGASLVLKKWNIVCSL